MMKQGTFYNVYRSTTSAGPYVIQPQLNNFSYSGSTVTVVDPNIAPGTKYYYTVQAISSSGSSPDSTPAIATTTPTSPTGLCQQRTTPWHTT